MDSRQVFIVGLALQGSGDGGALGVRVGWWIDGRGGGVCNLCSKVVKSLTEQAIIENIQALRSVGSRLAFVLAKTVSENSGISRLWK